MTVSQQRPELGHRPAVPGSGAGMAVEWQPSLRVAPSAGSGAGGAVNVPQGSEVISRGGSQETWPLGEAALVLRGSRESSSSGETARPSAHARETEAPRESGPRSSEPAACRTRPASGGDSPRDPGT